MLCIRKIKMHAMWQLAKTVKCNLKLLVHNHMLVYILYNYTYKLYIMQFFCFNITYCFKENIFNVTRLLLRSKHNQKAIFCVKLNQKNTVENHGASGFPCKVHFLFHIVQYNALLL